MLIPILFITTPASYFLIQQIIINVFFFYFKCVFNAGNRNKFAEENIHLEMILTLRIEISAGNKL